MPYFRNNAFNLLKQERRKSTLYFHTIISSRLFLSLIRGWKNKLLTSYTPLIATEPKGKSKYGKHGHTYAWV